MPIDNFMMGTLVFMIPLILFLFINGLNLVCHIINFPLCNKTSYPHTHLFLNNFGRPSFLTVISPLRISVC